MPSWRRKDIPPAALVIPEKDKMQVIIDRLEGNMAVVELPDGSHADLPRVLVPQAHEGDVVNIDVDSSATARQKQAVEELMNDLFAD